MHPLIKTAIVVNCTLIVLSALPLAFPNVFSFVWAALGVTL